MTWKPLHEKHAIDRVRLEVHFKDHLPPKLVNSIGEKCDQHMVSRGFAPRVPRAIAHIKVDMAMSGEANQKSESFVAGWQCVRLGFDGGPKEAIVLDPAVLVYEATEYSRWTVFLERMEEVCRAVFSEVDQVTAVSQIALDYTDRFFFSGSPNDARPDGAVRSDIAKTFQPDVQSGKEMWHMYRGWFQGVGLNRVLMNQNLDVQDTPTDNGSGMRTLQIYTRTDKRDSFSGLEREALRTDLSSMHHNCNAAVKWVLSSNLRSAVGL